MRGSRDNDNNKRYIFVCSLHSKKRCGATQSNCCGELLLPQRCGIQPHRCDILPHRCERAPEPIWHEMARSTAAAQHHNSCGAGPLQLSAPSRVRSVQAHAHNEYHSDAAVYHNVAAQLSGHKRNGRTDAATVVVTILLIAIIFMLYLP